MRNKLYRLWWQTIAAAHNCSTVFAIWYPTHHPKRHLDQFSRFSKIHGRYQQTDGTTTELHL